MGTDLWTQELCWGITQQRGLSLMMTPEERKAKVARINEEALNKGNLDAFDELYAPDFVRHNPPFPDRGLAAYKQYMREWTKAYSALHFTLDGQTIEGDKGVVWWTYRGTHTGESPASVTYGTRPTGKPVTFTGINLSRWVGDKVVEEWVWVDYLGVQKQTKE
jgi:predicted ester cyclase